jgi:hypothetical protein
MLDASEKSAGDPQDKHQRKERLTARLEAGFREWHSLKSEAYCLKRKSLDLALEYGPLILEWKELVGHGTWQKEVREKVNGADLRTCNRWKRIAQHKEKVLTALAQWLDVRWGLVKMLAYLSGKFDPANPQRAPSRAKGGDDTASAEGATTSAGKDDDSLGSTVTDEGQGDGPAGEATLPRTLRFPATSSTRPGANGTASPLPHGRSQKPRLPKRPVPDAGAGVTEYEVEIVKVLKVIVPKNVTEDVVKKAFENKEVQFQISVQGQAWTLSDVGIPGKVKHVRPWG